MGIEKSVVVLKRIYKLWFTKEEQDMSKCRLNVGGAVFILDTTNALEVFRLLNDTPMQKLDYDYVPKRDSATGESQSLYYLKSADEAVRLESVSAEDYAMWLLYTSTRENKK